MAILLASHFAASSENMSVEIRVALPHALNDLLQLAGAIGSMRTHAITLFGQDLPQALRTRSARQALEGSGQQERWRTEQDVHTRTFSDTRLRDLFTRFWAGTMATDRIGSGMYSTAEAARSSILADVIVLVNSLLLQDLQAARLPRTSTPPPSPDYGLVEVNDEPRPQPVSVDEFAGLVALP